MDWLLLAVCAIMAWVTLAVFSGERLRRLQEKAIRTLIDESAKAGK